MGNINYDQRHQSITQHSKIVRYGKYEETQNEFGEVETKVIKSISPASFYKLYIELNNVVGSRVQGGETISTELPDTPIELLVHIMLKDDDFTLVFRNKDATLVKLANEINKTPSSVYSTLSKLRKAGYIIKDEDNLLTLNQELHDLVKMTKYYLRAGKPLKFDFLFKFCITDIG